MKKVLSVMLALVMVIVGGFAFAACEKSDKITSISLSYIPSDIPGCPMEYNGENSVEKLTEYTLTTNYGTTIDLSNIKVIVNCEESGSKEINSNEYKVTSTIPTSNIVPAGNYEVKYEYQEWTVKVNVKVNKLIINTPTLAEYYYSYTGSAVLPVLNNFDYNAQQYIKTVGQVGQTEVGKHTVEFELKDKANTVWGILPQGATEYTITENQFVEWTIDKGLITIDKTEFVLDKANYGSREDKGNGIEAFTYNDNEEHPFSEIVNMQLLNSLINDGKITVSYTHNSQPFNGVPKAEDTIDGDFYAMVISIVQPQNYSIKFSDQTQNPDSAIYVYMYINC